MILLAVPLSMVGALAALQLTGGTLNVYSQIGLITLVGLISKHGILIVEFSNQLRQQGRATLEAVVEAASLRLRPILMTTGAMVLGALPLALADGAGAESRQQIGWVIVGGMSLGTLLTIFVVPTVYLLFARNSVPGENRTPVLRDEAVPGKIGMPAPRRWNFGGGSPIVTVSSLTGRPAMATTRRSACTAIAAAIALPRGPTTTTATMVASATMTATGWR